MSGPRAQHAVVVGAGLAGLSAACHLRGRGFEVTVLESGDGPGGRNGVLRRDGFTFDTGPTVLTMPDLIDDALRAVGTSVAAELDLQRLDPAYRGRFADGSTLHVRHGHAAMRAEIATHCGEGDAAAFDEFVPWLQRLYLTEMPHFISRNFDSPIDLLTRPRAALELLRLGAFGRLGAQIDRRFADERLRRLFSFQALYAGLAPAEALAIYAVITYMDSIEGVYFPAGGMRAVPEAMAAAAQRAGVVFRYETPLSRLVVDGSGAVTGVELADGERLETGAVVLTPDLPVAYDRFLPDLRPPRGVRGFRGGDYSPSAVVWHLGVRGVPGQDGVRGVPGQDGVRGVPAQEGVRGVPGEDGVRGVPGEEGVRAVPDSPIAHHNIHFGHEWASCFDDLLHRGTLMRDPSRLVTVHSLHDAGAAPAGCSTLYVLEPVPNLDVGKVDWAAEEPRMKERLLSFLADEGYPTDVVTDEFVGPVQWAEQGMAAGTPFALAHTFAQTGPFRPPNVERRRPGVFFAGSGTVPGVGVPMVLVSGKLAAERVEQAAGARR